MRFALLVFDWDGTIVDSEARIVETVSRAVDGLGLPPPPAARVREVIGLGLHEATEVLFPGRGPAFADRFVAAYRSRWQQRRDEAVRLFEGAAETLRALRAEGYRLGVATGKGRRGLDHELTGTGLAPLFDATRCADEAPSKPHPGMLEQILDDLAVRAADTLVIGDTQFDLDMARAAGASAVGVASGVHDRGRLLGSSPLAVLDGVAQLPAWLASRRDAGQPITR